jgi:transposase
MQELYAPMRRPSISPEKLLRALLLQASNSVRSERQLETSKNLGERGMI